MLRRLKTFIKDPAPTAKYEEVEPGLNIVEGIVRLVEPIRSPVRGQGCVAFFYRSFLMITGGRAPAIHKIKQVEVYAPFQLEMTGGALNVIPAKTTQFEQRDHQALQKQYGAQFQGVEEVILPGARVRVRGKVKVVDQNPVLTLKDIEVLDKKAAPSVGTGGKRKKKRRR